MIEAVLALLEVVALALPAYALVLKAIADQPVRYPTEAVTALSVAIGTVLVAGMVLVAWLMYDSLLVVPTIAGLLVIVSFGAMMYGLYHFANRQEELEQDDEPAEK